MSFYDVRKQVKTHSVIFFDVFDTILTRLTPKPEDVFKLVESKFDSLKGAVTDFSKNRIIAEKLCRANSTKEEITYDDIYLELEKIYGQNDSVWLKQMELEVEAKITVVNKPVYEIYQQCLQDKKKVFFVSDMYLPGKVIENLLELHQIKDFDGVYSSSDFGKTKCRNGLLFDDVISVEHLKRDEILHIGNDSNADYKKPKERGLDAILVPFNRSFLQGRYHKRAPKNIKNRFQYRVLDGFIGWYLNEHRDECLQFKLGFEIFGPLLFGYTKWLSDKCDVLGLHQVFFLSRDGYILEKAFNLLREDIKTDYLHVSRKSVIIPTICFENTFEGIINHYKSWPSTFTAEFVFTRFSVPENIIRKLIKNVGLEETKLYNYSDLINDVKFRLAIHEVLPFLKQNSRKQLELFLKYLEWKNFHDRVGIVDIGGNCSIEFALNELIGKAKITVKPFYLYMNRSIEDSDNREAYIDLSRDSLQSLAIRRCCYMFLELLLAAPHGTVLEYSQQNDKIIPILADDEFNHLVGTIDEKFFIENLQRGAMDFVRQFTRHFGVDIDVPQDIILSNFICFGTTPLQEDVDCWGDFCTYEDSYYKLINDRRDYWRHPILFLDDMKKSVWVGGFLMRHLDNAVLIRLLLILYKLYKSC